ncbi:MAG: uroporphyrinogen decarboxylase [Magnetovibrio sp.]|nr:uroporphyrinogen decarboxylase [Magnetovibrio sp.]|tara:strand:- start:929 stop:1969 length:1041 start_codon:yes stop_codon:yes gene_type:complete
MQANKKLLIQTLKNEQVIRPPIWFMRQAGRYLPEYRRLRTQEDDFLKFCYTPDLAVEATLQPLRRFKLDAAILFSDILVIPNALGQNVVFQEGKGPVLDPIQNKNKLKKLSLEKLHNNLEKVYETISILSKEIPKQTTLIGFAGAPWTVATYMVQGQGSKDCPIARAWAYQEPSDFSNLIQILTKATIMYLIKQIDNGAEVVQIFDTWAGVLSDNQFKKWVINPTKEIVKNVKKVHPDVPIIGFPRGAGTRYLKFIDETHVDGISLDNGISVGWASNNIQNKCVVQGNLDNTVLIAGGTAMKNEACVILKGFSDGSHIFNLGHGILPQTPPENISELIEIIHNWKS